ncbi:hypothetical protein UCRPA7_7295 [Phaeoacremonium minimum UCRPA7]|uniref:Uncharacterized protein n=1 Tax=Phaeoacremonium minimum (strain UCR-PA7) TaxID=1286976 RepID=R8BD58_PHAM7|nr:hypothetical protein UCRPA7_7295 [Phaeoacremonium minimum UCRPA7]EON97222.1 hypothetical protein UCRPA7_7295 [Phaeoacremonium minimum UCRPA7]
MGVTPEKHHGQRAVALGTGAPSRYFSLRIASILISEPAAEHDHPAGPGGTFPLLALPVEIRHMIVKLCLVSPNVETDDRWEVAGPTIAQKGKITTNGRDWETEDLKPYLTMRRVCRALREDAGHLVGQVNVFKIKHPYTANVWFTVMDRDSLSSLRALSVTLVTMTRRKQDKYLTMTDAWMKEYWCLFFKSLVGVPLQELRINFAEWTKTRKTAFFVPFWYTLGCLTVTKRLTFEGNYPREGLIFVRGIQARNPKLVFVDEGDQYDWE